VTGHAYTEDQLVERLAHILEHPEMQGMEDRIAETLLRPEVTFEQRPGVFRETANPHVMEKVDEKGNVLGFSVMRVSALCDAPLEVAL